LRLILKRSVKNTMAWNTESLKNSQILVVDDNVINRKVLSSVLKENGYQVRIASDGVEALQSVYEHRPDLILLDIQMPEMDGFEVCRHLKEHHDTEDIPIIFITASDGVDKKVEGFRLGAVDYISRPFQMAEVLARVSSQLSLRSLQREADEENDRLQKILDAVPVPYFIARVADGSFRMVSDRAKEQFGWTDGEGKEHKNLDTYANPKDREKLFQNLRLNGQVTNKEFELKNDQDETFPALVNASIVRLGGEDVIFATFNNISERKKTERLLEVAATTDDLTGILNRRAFIERANAERERANRSKAPLCLLMIDIDHFKKVNDTHGHDVGDLALKELVRIVGKDLRSSDLLGRLGGEEFALLLPETDITGAEILANRIRSHVKNNQMPLSTGGALTMTISGGLVCWPEDQDYTTTLKVADELLYAAKDGGRNQIKVMTSCAIP